MHAVSGIGNGHAAGFGEPPSGAIDGDFLGTIASCFLADVDRSSNVNDKNKSDESDWASLENRGLFAYFKTVQLPECQTFPKK